MQALRFRWDSRAKTSQKTLEQNVKSSPIVKYILTHKKLGMPKNVIFEKLMQAGYSYRNIKNAYAMIDKISKTSALDWRSPTAINETARMIRRDIRNNKISYAIGMKILIQARNNLRTLTTNKRDNRLKQINDEIRITKNLLMKQYGNPLMIKKYSSMK